MAASGGEVHVLDAGGAGALQRARGLRALAAQFDVVLLHVYVEDIVPLLAFFDAAHPTPVAFMVQADHQFFMGLSASQLVVHLTAPLLGREHDLDRGEAFAAVPVDRGEDAAHAGYLGGGRPGRRTILGRRPRHLDNQR